MQVTLDIPDTLAAQLTAGGLDPARAVLEALALDGYRTRRLSEAQLRRILGLEHRLDVHAFLAAHDVPLNYSLNDWEHDKHLADTAANTPHPERSAA